MWATLAIVFGLTAGFELTNGTDAAVVVRPDAKPAAAYRVGPGATARLSHASAARWRVFAPGQSPERFTPAAGGRLLYTDRGVRPRD